MIIYLNNSKLCNVYKYFENFLKNKIVNNF